MLAKHYRFQVKNETGETITSSDLEVIRRKLGTSGTTFEGTASELLGGNGDSISDGAVGSGTAQNNDSDGWQGLDGRFYVTISSGTPDGRVILFYQVSEDGTDWPDDEEGYVAGVLEFTGSTGTIAIPVIL